jgi:hypothetical protein
VNFSVKSKIGLASTLLMILAFGGLTFGRFEWFFGISGGVVTALALSVFLLIGVVKSSYVLPSNIVQKLFLCWVFGSIFSILLSAGLGEIPYPAALMFIFEIVFCSILFLAGFYAITAIGDPLSVFKYAVPWFFLGIYLQYSGFLFDFSVRRIHGELGSPNYSGLIYGLFTLYFFHTFKDQLNRSRIKSGVIFILFLVSMLSLAAIGTRSVLIPVFLIIFLRIFFSNGWGLKIAFFFSIFLVSIFVMSKVDITPALSRLFSGEFLYGIMVRFDLIYEAVNRADGVVKVLFGLPYQYTIFYEPGRLWLHPHNLLVSIYTFLGVFSFILFCVYLLFFLSKLYSIVRNQGSSRGIFFIADCVIVALIYSFASGEFTRIWVVYFLFGVGAAMSVSPRRIRVVSE